jgi:hypothetical protein
VFIFLIPSALPPRPLPCQQRGSRPCDAFAWFYARFRSPSGGPPSPASGPSSRLPADILKGARDRALAVLPPTPFPNTRPLELPRFVNRDCIRVTHPPRYPPPRQSARRPDHPPDHSPKNVILIPRACYAVGQDSLLRSVFMGNKPDLDQLENFPL